MGASGPLVRRSIVPAFAGYCAKVHEQVLLVPGCLCDNPGDDAHGRHVVGGVPTEMLAVG